MRWLSTLVVLLALGVGGNRTVITRDGKVYEGVVTREGAVVVVTTSSSQVRLPARSVVAIFETFPEARREAGQRLDQAKRLFEEASARPERDPLRRRQLAVSLDICREIRDLILVIRQQGEAGEHSEVQDRLMVQLPQFMRLVRDAMGATATAEGSLKAPIETVPLECLGLEIKFPSAASDPAEVREDLGPGQVAVLGDLASTDPETRALAARKLTSPPAPHALAALAKVMQKESHRDVLAALVEAIARLDVEPHLKSEFAWAAGEDELNRRIAIISLGRRLPSRAGCDFIGECFRTRPPTHIQVRVAFASAFRKFRPRSIEVLREALLKSKDGATRAEVVRQLGVLRDRAVLPILKMTLVQGGGAGGSPDLFRVSIFAIESLGKACVPLLVELMGDSNSAIKRQAQALAKRITEEEVDGIDELQKWWARNRKYVDEEEKEFWKEQEKKDFPVGADEFRIFERRLPDPRD
ncbi:MAG TPA: HEAT repeat domain-containing protein [Planctomycetota bacterium]